MIQLHDRAHAAVKAIAEARDVPFPRIVLQWQVCAQTEVKSNGLT